MLLGTSLATSAHGIVDGVAPDYSGHFGSLTALGRRIYLLSTASTHIYGTDVVGAAPAPSGLHRADCRGNPGVHIRQPSLVDIVCRDHRFPLGQPSVPWPRSLDGAPSLDIAAVPRSARASVARQESRAFVRSRTVKPCFWRFDIFLSWRQTSQPSASSPRPSSAWLKKCVAVERHSPQGWAWSLI